MQAFQLRGTRSSQNCPPEVPVVPVPLSQTSASHFLFYLIQPRSPGLPSSSSSWGFPLQHPTWPAVIGHPFAAAIPPFAERILKAKVEMWLTVLLIIPILLYLYNQRALTHWKRKGVFQLDAKFLFGNIYEILIFKKSFTDFVTEIYKKHKEKRLVGFYSFYRPMLLVSDPQLVKQALVTDFNNFSGTGFEVYESNEPMLAINPFGTTDFETWKERRGMHVALHTPSKLRLIPEAITKVGHNMVNFILQSPNGSVNLTQLAKFFPLDAVTATALGMEPLAFLDPNNFIPENTYEALTPSFGTAFDCAFLYPNISRLLCKRSFSPKCQKFFDTITPQLLSQREKSGNPRGDILDAILKMDSKKKSEGKKGLREVEKVGHVVAAFIDAYVTTGLTLHSFIKDLAEHPEEQEKVRKEIAAAGSKIEDFDFDTVNSLKYLQMALNETLRLHPALTITGRVCSKTSQLGDVTVEKGTKLLFPVKELHMDPDYFPEPEKYLPQRFENEHVKGTFLPFGDGPRMCLGMRYAQLVIKLAIANILLKFRILPMEKKETPNPDNSTLVFGHHPEEELLLFETL